VINISPTSSRQAAFGMPTSAHVNPMWMRALLVSKGDLSAQAVAGPKGVKGTSVSELGYTPVRTVEGTFPGTSVWSPPT
jgi:hypothetical protein